MYGVRVRLGMTNFTHVALESGAALQVPVDDDSLSLVFGPGSFSVGDIYSWKAGSESDGQWFKIKFDRTFTWDGSQNLIVDVSYEAKPWGQHGVDANFILRSTYGEVRTAVVYGDAKAAASLYEFIPALMLRANNSVAITIPYSESIPSKSSGSSFSLDLDISLNRKNFLAAEASQLIPGTFMYLNVTGDTATIEGLVAGHATQADLKSVLSAVFASAEAGISIANVVLNSIGSDAMSSKATAATSATRRRLASSSSSSTVVEIKIVSSNNFTLSSRSASSLHTQLAASLIDGSLLSDLTAVSTFSGLSHLGASDTFEMFSPSGLFTSSPSFTLYNTKSISVGSLYPSLSSIEGGTVVTISGSGFFTPVTKNGLVEIRWYVLNSDIWFTSYGEVGDSFEEIITTTPKVSSKLVPSVASSTDAGLLKVYVRVSFNGVTFSSISYVSYLIYYLTPAMNSFYLLDMYPTSIPQKEKSRLGDSYRYVYQMPQSGKVYDTSLKKDVQLYLYVNSSNLYLSASTTVCIFLNDATGDSSDDFSNCVTEGR